MIMEPLIPIFCIIVLGFAVSRTPVSSRSVWEGLERLTYYLFFPALLISRLSATRFEAAKLLDIGLSLGLALLVFTLLFAGLHRAHVRLLRRKFFSFAVSEHQPDTQT